MQVLVVTPPASFVSLELAKPHVKVELDDSDQDLLIQAYIDAACATIDGPEGYLGRAIGPQVIEVRFDSFLPDDLRGRYRIQPFRAPSADVLNLPYGPLLAVESVTYADTSNADQVLDPATYTLDPQGLVLAPNCTWPPTYLRRGAVRVRYLAGYVADADADPLVPAPPAAAVAAVLLMVGDLYENRETTDIGRVAQIPMSVTVDRLLAPLRVWSV